MGIIAKQSIQGTIVTYLGVAVGFVTTFFVLTRFLSAEEIGLARVLVDAATLFIGLAQLGTSSSIIRFYPHFKAKDERLEVTGKNSDHGFFFWTLIVPLVGFALFTAVYCACHEPLSQWFGEKSPLFVDYYYMVLPMAFFMLYQTIFETNANVRMHIVVPRAVRELITRIGLLVAYLL
ncbi:MAG: oligosaccharide flippase family protein, partial [Paludibacteraceae bacterium]|nr:oligosaccharide flippase family protein [Paludibacteraceae bacterium]